MEETKKCIFCNTETKNKIEKIAIPIKNFNEEKLLHIFYLIGERKFYIKYQTKEEKWLIIRLKKDEYISVCGECFLKILNSDAKLIKEEGDYIENKFGIKGFLMHY
jgi:hypothetical protein